MKTTILVAIALMFPLGLVAASGQEADPKPAATTGPALASPYVDLFHGFSLRPPAGAGRSNERSPSQLVSWRFRDPKTKAIVWTLAVNKLNNRVDGGDLQAFAKSLATTLKDKENFKLDASKVYEIADHKAVDLKGYTLGKVRWWHRQVWIVTTRPAEGKPLPSEPAFLLLRMTGPAAAAEEMDAALTAVLKTVKFIDAKEALAQRQQHLQAGLALLKSLDPKTVAAAVPNATRYFLIRRGETVTGYFITSCEAAKVGNADGLKTTFVAWTNAQGGSFFSQVTASAALDRSTEKWSEQVDAYTGKEPKDEAKSFLSSITGSLKDGKISCHVVSPPASPIDYVKPVPTEIYLPLAWKILLPRLIDLKKPATYSFARYVAAANSFDVDTISVLEGGQVEVDGKKVKAARIETRSAEDAPSDTLWLDDKGEIIKVESADGSVMEPATREKLLKEFPSAAKRGA